MKLGRIPQALRRLWRRRRKLVRLVPSLRVTRDGKILIAIAIAVGFAAMNTGHNPLFLGWGFLLASIILSGILSEANLAAVKVELAGADELRAGQRSPLALRLANRRRLLPAFGVEAAAVIDDGDSEQRAEVRYQLRLIPNSVEDLTAFFVPRRRGEHRVRALVARTAYPFGFFEKSWRLLQDPERVLLVYPARVEVGPLARDLLARAGVVSTHQIGPGEDFFSLRPFRAGDDIRRVAWRRSARTGDWVVREHERWAARKIVLQLSPPRPVNAHQKSQLERVISACGSLAEDLLARQNAVGLRAPGVALEPLTGSQQRHAILTALARLDVDDPRPVAPVRSDVLIVPVTLAGWGDPNPDAIELPAIGQTAFGGSP